MSESAVLIENTARKPLAKNRHALAWGKLAAQTVFSIYFYLAMEWLFFVTKPSFMDFMPFSTKLGILLLPGLLLSAGCLPIVLFLFAASRLPWPPRIARVFLALGALLPAGFIAATGLMLVDNFTYTVLNFGIIHTEGVQRTLYAGLFLLFLAVVWWNITRGLFKESRRKRADAGYRTQLYAALGLLVLSVPLGGSLFLSNQTNPSLLDVNQPARRPNILLIGSDGLDSDKTSIYGGLPDRTPFLRSFAEDSLLSMNHFANANFTSGSLVSMFSSKPPTQTRVLYPPDILQGSDAFQHLPGILKKAGYYNAEISVDYYTNPGVLNLQDSFVMVNGRSETIGRLYTLSRSYLPESPAYFFSMIGKRLTDRVFHIFHLRSMPDPYAEVREKLSNMSDEDRLGMVVSLFRDIDQPLFVHVHLMGTHTKIMDRYNQGLTSFDQYMRELMNELDLMGRLEQTVVIVYTDHGYANESHVRIPLMFRFPGGEHAGQIQQNTQNMDIAPTILDYIGVEPPDWMTGQSLLRGEPAASRPIFSAAPNYRTDEDNLMQLDLSKVKPPFYQFGVVKMVVCQKWYAANTTTRSWEEGQVQGHLKPCAPDSLPTTRQAQELLLRQMKKDGFDTALLEEALR